MCILVLSGERPETALSSGVGGAATLSMPRIPASSRHPMDRRRIGWQDQVRTEREEAPVDAAEAPCPAPGRSGMRASPAVSKDVASAWNRLVVSRPFGCRHYGPRHARGSRMDGFVSEIGDYLQNLNWTNSRASSQANVLWLLLLLIVGAAKNYWGFFLHKAVIMLIGGVIGAALGFGVGESSGWPAGLSVLFAMAAGCAAGWLAWILKLAMVFLIGACLGGLVAILETHQLSLALLGAAVGGVGFVSLYRPFIVLLTVAAGSVTLTYVTLNLSLAASGGLSALQNSHYGSWWRYVSRMYDLVSQLGLEGLMRHAAADAAVFAFFAATGIFWQFRNSAVIGEPRAAKGRRYRLAIRTPPPDGGSREQEARRPPQD